MNTTSPKIWLGIIVLITLAACTVPPIASAEQIELYKTYSWMSYGEGIASLFTYNEGTDDMKVIRVYYNSTYFTSVSDFTSSFEEDVDEVHDLVVFDFEDTLSEVTGLVSVNGESWMAKWTPDDGYTVSIVENSTSTNEVR